MDQFWLTDEQFAKIAPHLPTDTRGKERVDDRRVISGIVHMLKSGGRWTDEPREVYGPKKTLYNRFVCWAAKWVWVGLLPEDEAVVVAFRRHTLLPLDDCLYALQATIPHLTRSSLHRCLQRHGISRLPEVDGDKPKRSRFKAYPLGYFHIDLAEVHTAEGRLYLLVAIDRTTKFAFVELHEKATRRVAGDFLRHLIDAVPYKVHTVLTDNVLRSEERWLARQQVSVREHAPAVCLSSTSIQAAPADPEELSAIANTGSSRCTRHRGPHRPQHEMSIQAGDPSIVYRVVVLTPSRLC